MATPSEYQKIVPGPGTDSPRAADKQFLARGRKFGTGQGEAGVASVASLSSRARVGDINMCWGARECFLF